LAGESLRVPVAAGDAGLVYAAVQRIALHQPLVGAVGAGDAEPLSETQGGSSARHRVNTGAVIERKRCTQTLNANAPMYGEATARLG